MEVDNVGVHARHCCILHGCNYGDSDCPVITEEVVQEYLCEFCDDDEVESVEEAKAIHLESDAFYRENAFNERPSSGLLRELLHCAVVKTDDGGIFKVGEAKINNSRIFVRAWEGKDWYGESRILDWEIKDDCM
jgi:hypothetical protein